MDESPNLGKKRIRRHDWAIFRHPNEKRAAGGLVGETAGDALTHALVEGAKIWIITQKFLVKDHL
jgi:hypothetical protein